MAAFARVADARSLAAPGSSRLVELLLASACLFVLYTIAFAIYHLYWSPLAHVPGRTLWITFPILKHFSALQGRLNSDIQQMHLDLGPILRLGPHEVSFITVQAWSDIYGMGHRQLPKIQRFPKNEVHNIINADDANHSRFRKSLSHAFSERALRDQEFLMRKYIDLLIDKLHSIAESRMKTDMVAWYNYTTFDLIGDLAFGQSFNCLTNAQSHFWVTNVLGFLHSSVILRAGFDYPLLITLFRLFMPKSVMESRKAQYKFTRDTVLKRIHNEELHGRGDFMDSMLRHKNDKDALSEEELISNANILVVAGSETTSTLLSGVTYYLAKDLEILKRATNEVRSNFEREEDITFIAATAKLPYMLACLNEAMRRYPPVPTTLQRITLPGGPTTISGIDVPPNTIVGVPQTAAYWSPVNFHDPLRYCPERWLPEAFQPESPFYNDKREVLKPFVVGPRNCIGKNLAYNEMRLILARVLWNFDLILCEESKDWENQKSYMLWTKKPELNVILRKRKDIKRSEETQW